MAPTKFMYVKGNRNDDRVALSEVDDAHPGGSVFVARRMVRKVARTPFVQDQIHDGHLVETDDPDDIAAADKFLQELLASEAPADAVSSEKYSDMDQAELAAEAKSRGISFKGKVNKATVVAALEADDALKSSAETPPAPPTVPAEGAATGDVPPAGDAATHGA